MSKEIIMTSSAFIVCDDKALLIKHEKSGLWLVPGGKRNPDETLQQAAIRETKEETGLDIVLQDGTSASERVSTKYAQELVAPKGSFLINTPFGETHHDFCFFATVSDNSTDSGGEYKLSDENWFSVSDLEATDVPHDIKKYAIWAIDLLGS